MEQSGWFTMGPLSAATCPWRRMRGKKREDEVECGHEEEREKELEGDEVLVFVTLSTSDTF